MLVTHQQNEEVKFFQLHLLNLKNEVYLWRYLETRPLPKFIGGLGFNSMFSSIVCLENPRQIPPRLLAGISMGT